MEVVATTVAISLAKLQSNHQHQQTNIYFFTGRAPFLSPNQQCQSTEGKRLKIRLNICHLNNLCKLDLRPTLLWQSKYQYVVCYQVMQCTVQCSDSWSVLYSNQDWSLYTRQESTGHHWSEDVSWETSPPSAAVSDEQLCGAAQQQQQQDQSRGQQWCSCIQQCSCCIQQCSCQVYWCLLTADDGHWSSECCRW